MQRYEKGLLISFVALAVLYSIVTPIWEAPDEVGHMAYATYIARYKALPTQGEWAIGEAHHPPLYYLVAAVPLLAVDFEDSSGTFKFNRQIVWGGEGGSETNAAVHGKGEGFPYRGQALAVHLARLVSVACAALSVLLTFRIAMTVLGSHEIALLAGALVAFNPQFLFISASVNNDNLVTAICSGLIFFSVRSLARPPRLSDWLLLGLLTGCAMLTKLSCAPIVLTSAAILLVQTARQGSGRLLAIGPLLAAIVFGPLAGW